MVVYNHHKCYNGFNNLKVINSTDFVITLLEICLLSLERSKCLLFQRMTDKLLNDYSFNAI